MSKFKLIKEYPHSPKLGTVISRRTIGEDYWTYDNYTVVLLRKDTPENYPEFWEKVIEKDYEILSFINTLNSTIYVPCNHERTLYNTHGDFNFGIGERSLNYCLKHYKIQSVKRLSDGEVFTIGDKIYFRGLYGNSSEHKYDTVNGFDFKIDTSLGILYHNGLVGLNKIEKYKEPETILTTYDGVEIYKGDSIYGVTNCFTLIYEPFIEFCNFNYSKYFAKKENAEKYIRDNEKKYSLNDIKETVNKLGCFGTTLIEYLENENKNR